MTDKERQAFRVKALLAYKDKCQEDHIKWCKEQHLATCEIENLTPRLEQIKEKVGLGNDEIFVYLKPEDDASVIPAEFEGVKVTIREHPGRITAL